MVKTRIGHFRPGLAMKTSIGHFRSGLAVKTSIGHFQSEVVVLNTETCRVTKMLRINAYNNVWSLSMGT